MQNDKHKIAQHMIDSQLRASGINDVPVLNALMEVNRHNFVLNHLQNVAFIDRPIHMRQKTHLVSDRTLFAPFVFAKILQELHIQSTDIVLDIGCGTGYSAAVLSRIAQSVIAVDSDEDFVNHATQLMIHQNIGNAVIVYCSDMSLGYTQEAPYDIIIIEGGVHSVPPVLFEQLAEGGKLCAIEVSAEQFGEVFLYAKDHGKIVKKRLFESFHPVLEGFEKDNPFIF